MKRSKKSVFLFGIAVALAILPVAGAQPTPFRFAPDADVNAEFGVGANDPHDFDVRSLIEFVEDGSFELNLHDLTLTIAETNGADSVVLFIPEGDSGWRPEGSRLKFDGDVTDQVGREFDFSFDVILRSGGTSLADVEKDGIAELNTEADTMAQLGFACASDITFTVNSGGRVASKVAESECE